MEFWTVMSIATAAFVVAGAVKGVVGIGLPTTAMGLMTLIIDPRTAIALILFPMIGANLWQTVQMGHITRTVRRYAVFSIILVTGVVLTVFGTSGADDRVLMGALGLVLLLFVWFSWRGWVPELPDRYDNWAQAGFGLFGGIIGGLTSGWAAPVAMYLSSQRADKDEFLRASGWLIFIGSLPLAVSYASLGFLTGPLAGASAAMLIPTMLGFCMGTLLQRRLSPERFRVVLLWVFVALAMNLLRRAMF